MISIALVGLCLTSLPNLPGVLRRPLRPEIPLASYFPAWVDSAYGPVNFAVDEVRLLYQIYMTIDIQSYVHFEGFRASSRYCDNC